MSGKPTGPNAKPNPKPSAKAPGAKTLANPRARKRGIAALEREVRELRRTNEILRTASAFFAAAELDRRLK